MVRSSLPATGTKVGPPFPLVQLYMPTISTPDAQSWYHSQEANIMVDSAELASEWMAMLNHNQNSAQCGAVDVDGVWRDNEGNIVQSSGGYGTLISPTWGTIN